MGSVPAIDFRFGQELARPARLGLRPAIEIEQHDDRPDRVAEPSAPPGVDEQRLARVSHTPRGAEVGGGCMRGPHRASVRASSRAHECLLSTRPSGLAKLVGAFLDPRGEGSGGATTAAVEPQPRDCAEHDDRGARAGRGDVNALEVPRTSGRRAR